MDIGNLTTFALGLVAGVIMFALVLPSLTKRTKARHHAEVEKYERLIADLRQERANDRETNRRLRHELAISTPQHLEHTREERDSALEELDKLSTELRETTLELADRDRSLREARLAIHDIRVQLERDRFTAEGAAQSLVGDATTAETAAGDGGSEPESGFEASDADVDEWSDDEPGTDAGVKGDADDDDADRASTVFFGEYPMGEATTS